jgi:hypothetical protein
MAVLLLLCCYCGCVGNCATVHVAVRVCVQVYRATLVPELGGGDVAVKVQRPGVLAAVALDLFLIRHLAGAMQSNVRDDCLAVVHLALSDGSFEPGNGKICLREDGTGERKECALRVLVHQCALGLQVL